MNLPVKEGKSCISSEEITLGAVEKQKEDFKNIYFAKDNKDNEDNNLVESISSS